MPQNIELKVACTADGYASVRARLAERPLRSLETIQQTDTYFRVTAGRLKLRTIGGDDIASAELIQYQRTDTAGARVSTYRRVAIAPATTAGIKAALVDALGVLACVRKRRTAAVWRSTRIHLDEVEGLGLFVELETVLGNELTAEAGQAEYQSVVDWLGLASLTSNPGSYSDLLLMKGQDR